MQNVGGHVATQTRAQIVMGAGVSLAQNYRVQTSCFEKKKKKKKIFCGCVVVLLLCRFSLFFWLVLRSNMFCGSLYVLDVFRRF